VATPTRGKKTLDKVLTNMHSFYKTPEVISPLGTADHNVVICTLLPDYMSPVAEVRTVLTRSSGQNQRAFFADALLTTNWQQLYTIDSCDEQFNMLQSTITNILDTHMPLKKTKKCSSDRPWITPRFKELITRRQQAFKNKNIALYNELRNKVNRTNKKLRGAYYKEKIESLKKTDQKKWWKCVNELTGKPHSGGEELEGLANKLTEGDIGELAEKVNHFFQSVSADLPKPDKDILIPLDPQYTIPDEYIITVIEVEKQLMKLNVSKAPGPDGIPTWVLRDFAGQLAPPVCAIFNASVRQQRLPVVWKSAITCPIPKVSPPKAIESDLRPISLTCILSKELETHVVRWLWSKVLTKMDPYQFGAIAKCSTTHALVEMLHDWFSNTDNSKDKNFIHAVLVDYSKAFDRVNPNILLNKLKALAIPNFLLNWIHDFLSDRSQRVKIGEHMSAVLDVWGIVPQGTKLGIFLFLLMINDLHTLVPTYKYVDDTTIYKITSNSKCTQVQKAMNHIMSWSESNDMKINATKTKEILISFNRCPPEIPPSL
jgi:hypothetical protein